jgi:hypothetical protein
MGDQRSDDDQYSDEETDRRPTEGLPHADLADRIAEIIIQHTGMYGVSAHGIALEILALMKEDRRRANNSPIR